MHERQYRDYKSGVAAERFSEELEAKREESKSIPAETRVKSENTISSPGTGIIMFYVGGSDYIPYETFALTAGDTLHKGQRICYLQSGTTYYEIVSDRSGKIKRVHCRHGDYLTRGEPVVEFV